MLLEERLLSSILLGAGLSGLLVGVFFWIRRHAGNKAAQEREMFLSFKGDEKVWRFKFTFNSIFIYFYIIVIIYYSYNKFYSNYPSNKCFF